MFLRVLLLLWLWLGDRLAQSANQTNAGIYFRLNQRAVNYITNLTEEAMPQILEKMQFPTQVAGPATISELIIQRFARPQIRAEFVENKGVSAQVILPLIRISANAKVEIFLILDTDEPFELEFRNLTINMDVYFSRNKTTNRNIIEIPNCNVTAYSFKGIFNETLQLYLFEDMIRDAVTGMLQNKICQTTLDAIEFVDEQEIQPAQKTEKSATDGSNAGKMASEFGSSLCAMDKLETDEEEPEEAVTIPPIENTKKPSWGVDLTLSYPPRFTNDEVVFGVDGGILLDGRPAAQVERPQMLNTSLLDEKMIGIMLSDYIPNTMLSHLYDGGLGNYTEKLYTDQVPKFARSLAKLFCSKCYLQVTANLTGKPRMEISKTLGGRIEISGNVSVTFHGKKVHNLIHADATLHVTLKPSIRHSRLYGDVSLTNVDVNVKDIGIGGVLAFPLEKIANFVVPRAIWPQVKKRLRFAMNKRGIQLPILCGVEFEHMSLGYTDHAVVLNTDFAFDLPRFLRKFRVYLTEKGKQGATVPKWQ